MRLCVNSLGDVKSVKYTLCFIETEQLNNMTQSKVLTFYQKPSAVENLQETLDQI